MPLPAGSHLGHFEILSPIGAGGMGEVYRARDERLGREVAIKILPESLTSDEQSLLRFVREAKSLASISHPNILPLYELDRDESTGAVFFAMELLEGETLRSRIKNGPIAWDKALSIAASIADGLAAAHAKGIIHRDLKPENLFLTNDGVVKILDFGLARTVSEFSAPAESQTEAFLTGRGAVVGTFGYMSPEQIRGEPLGATTDIFCLGCILYEMITGMHPFLRGSAFETSASILRDDPPSLDQSGLLVPRELEAIIRHSLEKRADQRFQSAHDLAFNLRAAGSGASTRAAGESFDSIAVLPFESLAPDPDAEYLSDGITETIISKLSQIPNLRVMARSTVFRYKNQKIDPQVVGQSLNVRLVLHGRISQRGDALMIRTELIKVSDASQLWGERYHRKAADLFEIEEEIAREISEKLRIRLSGDQKQLLAHRYTEDTEAYHAYLKGRYQWNKRSEAALNSGILWFKEALEKDPAYALAYVGLADSYNILGFYSLLPPGDAFPKAEAAALRALELDDRLAEAYASLAYVKHYYRWEWNEAERNLKKAIELKDAYATAHHYYLNLLVARGRFDEAFAQSDRSLELDPLSLILNAARGWVLYFRHDFDGAIEVLRRTLAMDDTFGQAHLWLSWALARKRQFGEAIAEAQQNAAFSGIRVEALAAQAYAHAAAGEVDQARAGFDELISESKQRFVQPYNLAAIASALGNVDEALRWLQESVTIRSHHLVLLNVDPRFDEIRDHPEFRRIAEQVGV